MLGSFIHRGGLYWKNGLSVFALLLEMYRFIGSERQSWYFAWEKTNILKPFPLGTNLLEKIVRDGKSEWPREFGPGDIEPDAACGTIKINLQK